MEQRTKAMNSILAVSNKALITVPGRKNRNELLELIALELTLN